MVEALDVELLNRPLPGGLECNQLARVARLGAGAKPRGSPSFDRSGKVPEEPHAPVALGWAPFSSPAIGAQLRAQYVEQHETELAEIAAYPAGEPVQQHQE